MQACEMIPVCRVLHQCRAWCTQSAKRTPRNGRRRRAGPGEQQVVGEAQAVAGGDRQDLMLAVCPGGRGRNGSQVGSSAAGEARLHGVALPGTMPRQAHGRSAEAPAWHGMACRAQGGACTQACHGMERARHGMAKAQAQAHQRRRPQSRRSWRCAARTGPRTPPGLHGAPPAARPAGERTRRRLYMKVCSESCTCSGFAAKQPAARGRGGWRKLGRHLAAALPMLQRLAS